MATWIFPGECWTSQVIGWSNHHDSIGAMAIGACVTRGSFLFEHKTKKIKIKNQLDQTPKAGWEGGG
jgi:hypothetical protein